MELEINGKTVETDPEGYLANLGDWSEDVAEFLAPRISWPWKRITGR
jgi:sulfur relay (sulfurtransferase) DsrC/TusE family protein